MRLTKKTLTIIAILLIAACGFFACDERQEVNGSMTLVIGVETPVAYEVDLEEVEITQGVLSVLQHLKQTQELQYEALSSLYGAYLTKVGDLAGSSNSGTFICIYTSVSRDFDLSVWASTVEYEGITLVSSGVGISEMTLEKDCIIYFGLSSY